MKLLNIMLLLSFVFIEKNIECMNFSISSHLKNFKDQETQTEFESLNLKNNALINEQEKNKKFQDFLTKIQTEHQNELTKIQIDHQDKLQKLQNELLKKDNTKNQQFEKNQLTESLTITEKIASLSLKYNDLVSKRRNLIQEFKYSLFNSHPDNNVNLGKNDDKNKEIRLNIAKEVDDISERLESEEFRILLSDNNNNNDDIQDQ